jgi:hypothetical protein
MVATAYGNVGIGITLALLSTLGYFVTFETSAPEVSRVRRP